MKKQKTKQWEIKSPIKCKTYVLNKKTGKMELKSFKKYFILEWDKKIKLYKIVGARLV